MNSPLWMTCAVSMLMTVSSFLSGCATTTLFEDDPELQRDLDLALAPESGFSYWMEKPGNGPLRVTIDLSDQAAYVRRGNVPIARVRVATGKPGHGTPTGDFTIIEKTIDKSSNLYGRIFDAQGNVVVPDADTRKHDVPSGGRYVGAPMPYWMRLTSSGIGMHAGPIPYPGQPASHGCIRMPMDMAQLLFENAPLGTPVTVVP